MVAMKRSCMRYTTAAVLLLLVPALCLTGCRIAPPASGTADTENAGPAAAPDGTVQAENMPPAILSVQAAPQQIAPLETTEILCRAEDSDGSELYYSWSIEAGSISGKGEAVSWKAPAEEGHYSIGVTVTDGYGGASTDMVYVNVEAPIQISHSPSMVLMVQPAGEPPFQVFPGQDPVKVRQWSNTILRCNAEDPDGDELTIAWEATGGDIDPASETMDKVYYIAKERSLQTITVTVTDSSGRQTEAQIVFNVQCCGGH